MNEYEIVKFEIDDISLDIKYSPLEETFWLSKEDMSTLFKRDRSAISRRIKQCIEVDPKQESNVRFLHIPNSDKPVAFYNLDIVVSVGYSIKSNNGVLLKESLNRYITKNQKNLEGNTIIYHNGDISLPVTISPEEETIWLNVNQIAELFDTSTDNIYLHINNIYKDEEINVSVTEDSLVTQKEIAYKSSDGKIYQTLFYNLDVILAVGYRVKSSKAIMFRRWANSVLKEYLLKGYVINEKRTLVTNENYINLINRVDNIDNRVSRLESSDNLEKEKIFFDGEYFDARSFIEQLIQIAKKQLILIDPYSDVRTLEFLKYKNSDVEITLCTSSHSILTKGDINYFNKQYGGLKVIYNDIFHDRFLILDDNEIYHLGASINYAGRKVFAVTAMDDKFVEMIKRAL